MSADDKKVINQENLSNSYDAYLATYRLEHLEEALRRRLLVLHAEDVGSQVHEVERCWGVRLELQKRLACGYRLYHVFVECDAADDRSLGQPVEILLLHLVLCLAHHIQHKGALLVPDFFQNFLSAPDVLEHRLQRLRHENNLI